jgi:hypothetical protein
MESLTVPEAQVLAVLRLELTSIAGHADAPPQVISPLSFGRGEPSPTLTRGELPVRSFIEVDVLAEATDDFESTRELWLFIPEALFPIH